MSNGAAGIARVEIENGSITIDEVWGGFTPDPAKSVELQLSYTTHDAAVGNAHMSPKEVTETVWLTTAELLALVDQLTSWAESVWEHADNFRLDGEPTLKDEVAEVRTWKPLEEKPRTADA